jgi:hypothetical protein
MTTPKGLALDPYLNTPDFKFNADGDYKVTLVLPSDSDETQAFIAKLDAVHAASVAKAKGENKGKRIKVAAMSINTEAEAGKVHIRFRLMAKVTPKEGAAFTQNPALFDAAGKPMNKVVGGGSVVKLAFVPIPFYSATFGAGITLRLKAVQVIQLLAGDPGNGNPFGFVAEPGYQDDGIMEST